MRNVHLDIPAPLDVWHTSGECRERAHHELRRNQALQTATALGFDLRNGARAKARVGAFALGFRYAHDRWGLHPVERRAVAVVSAAQALAVDVRSLRHAFRLGMAFAFGTQAGRPKRRRRPRAEEAAP